MLCIPEAPRSCWLRNEKAGGVALPLSGFPVLLLPANPQLGDHRAIALDVYLLQVVEHPAALAD